MIRTLLSPRTARFVTRNFSTVAVAQVRTDAAKFAKVAAYTGMGMAGAYLVNAPLAQTESGLWSRFESKLAEADTKFDDLDTDSDWCEMLKACGFNVFESGKLLKSIKAKKAGLAAGESDDGASHGASHGAWSDPTYCKTGAEPHAPRYFKSYSDFVDDLKNYKGELMLRDILTEEMYNKYKDVTTSLGVTVDKCIKGGVDKAKLGDEWNTGKVGLMFGDAESVSTFAELVHPIMLARHGNPTLPHPPPNLDGSKLLDHKNMDASYVISTRVRTGRSISGFPLPPSIGADQRKELEGIVTSALENLTGDLKGEYYPLAGSNTYAPKPGGIDKATEERLIKEHFLFQEPDEPMLLSWRMERDWPHARGIYHNPDKTALVWVNEEDHMRIMSMQKGNDIRAVFDRFAGLVKAVEGACKTVGRRLEIDPMYGNILSCPSNCGTGLRASMMIKIPLSSKQPNFKKWCDERALQARGSGGFASAAKDDGIRDVSNNDRMGKDEVTLVNEMIKGVTDLIEWEKQLEIAAKK